MVQSLNDSSQGSLHGKHPNKKPVTVALKFSKPKSPQQQQQYGTQNTSKCVALKFPRGGPAKKSQPVIVSLKFPSKSSIKSRIEAEANQQQQATEDSTLVEAAPLSKRNHTINFHKWTAKFTKLREFFKVHGHLCTKNPEQQKWLAFQKRNLSSLSKLQLELLESINFSDWEPEQKLVPQKENKRTWYEMFSELQKMSNARKQGHQEKYPPKLQHWIDQQIRHERLGTLKDEKRRMLMSCGVDVSKPSVKRKPRAITQAWLANFEKLKRYHKTHGHFQAPYTADLSFAQWIERQRKRYKQTQILGYSLDQEWVHKLEGIGFPWSVRIKKTDGTGK